MADCIFCTLIESPERQSGFIYQDEQGVAFHDINPQAPVHVLVVPKRHVTSAAELADRDTALLGHLISICQRVTTMQGIRERGYRIVLNTGQDGGQTVSHLHFHVLGGRRMRWPPG